MQMPVIISNSTQILNYFGYAGEVSVSLATQVGHVVYARHFKFLSSKMSGNKNDHTLVKSCGVLLALGNPP